MPVASSPSRATYVRRRVVVGLLAAALLGGGVAAQTLHSDGRSGAADVPTTSTSAGAPAGLAPTSTPFGAPTGSAPPIAPASPVTVASTVAGTAPATAAPSAAPTSPAPITAGPSSSVGAVDSTQVSTALTAEPTAPAVDAAAYGAYDLTAGKWLTVANADVPRPVGSIMKLLTAYVVMRAGDSSKVVTVPNLTLDPEESIIGLYAGEKLPRDVLLRAMLIVSANDAAEALAVDVGGTREAFVEQMNQAARDLGLGHTVAANPSGLDAAGAESTVRDVVTLAAVLMADPTFRATVARPSASLHGQTFPATNELLGTYPGADGIKTGSTTGAGYGVVASATRGGRTIVVAVLGAPSDQGRFTAAATVLDWAFGRPA